MTVIGFGAYNYVKISSGTGQPQLARRYGALPGAEADTSVEVGAEGGAEGVEPDAAWLRSATAVGVRVAPWLSGSSVSLNLALYVLSGVFQPLFVMARYTLE